MKSLQRKIQSFLHNEEGAQVIEMAIISPILFLVVMSVLEFGLIMYTSSLLDTITHQATRYAKTGFDYGSGSSTFNPYGNERFDPSQMENYFTYNADESVTMDSRESFIRSYIHTAGRPLLDPESIVVETQILAEITNAGVTGTISAPYNFGGTSQAVLYKISYKWSILTPLMMFLGEDGVYDIISTTLVKNEEYS